MRILEFMQSKNLRNCGRGFYPLAFRASWSLLRCITSMKVLGKSHNSPRPSIPLFMTSTSYFLTSCPWRCPWLPRPLYLLFLSHLKSSYLEHDWISVVGLLFSVSFQVSCYRVLVLQILLNSPLRKQNLKPSNSNTVAALFKKCWKKDSLYFMAIP